MYFSEECSQNIFFRGLDISRSWARDVIDGQEGDVTVFADNPKKITFPNMNIITLDGVNDNMYPPQRKSYSVRFL